MKGNIFGQTDSVDQVDVVVIPPDNDSLSGGDEDDDDLGGAANVNDVPGTLELHFHGSNVEKEIEENEPSSSNASTSKKTLALNARMITYLAFVSFEDIDGAIETLSKLNYPRNYSQF